MFTYGTTLQKRSTKAYFKVISSDKNSVLLQPEFGRKDRTFRISNEEISKDFLLVIH